MRSFLWLTFLLLNLTQNTLCILINVTVDDNDHSILYSPAGAWNARNAASSCPACTAQPDPTKMVSGTWHDSTFYPIDEGTHDIPNINTPRFANLTFNGSAVYVFCALAESVKSPDGNSDMAFYVDGQLMGHFFRPALGNDNIYEYQFPVFSNNSLAPGEHTLVLQNGRVNGTQSLVLLDYIVYTLGEDQGSSIEPSLSFSSTSSSTLTPHSSSLPNNTLTAGSHNNTTKIIATSIIVPTIVLLLILSLLLFRRTRRRRRMARQSHFFHWHRDTVVPVPRSALTSWMIEPLSLPPSHPASGYVNGSGRPVTSSVPSAPTASSEQDPAHPAETPKRSHHAAVSSTASSSSYGRVIHVHNLDDYDSSIYLAES